MNESSITAGDQVTASTESKAVAGAPASTENNKPSPQAGAYENGNNPMTETAQDENQTKQNVAKKVSEREIDIVTILIDHKNRPRATVSKQVVAEYAAAMKAGAVFPPIDVFFYCKRYWLVDGDLRRLAYIELGETTIRARVHKGSRRDATMFALQANAKHGCRLSNADKRKAVKILLADTEWRLWSLNKIVQLAGVSWNTVREVWRQVQNELLLPSFEEREDVKAMRGGKVITQKPRRKPAANEHAAEDLRVTAEGLHRVLGEAATASLQMAEALREPAGEKAEGARSHLAGIAGKVAEVKAMLGKAQTLLRRASLSAAEAGTPDKTGSGNADTPATSAEPAPADDGGEKAAEVQPAAA
jgi:hypothetical protein